MVPCPFFQMRKLKRGTEWSNICPGAILSSICLDFLYMTSFVYSFFHSNIHSTDMPSVSFDFTRNNTDFSLKWNLKSLLSPASCRLWLSSLHSRPSQMASSCPLWALPWCGFQISHWDPGTHSSGFWECWLLVTSPSLGLALGWRGLRGLRFWPRPRGQPQSWLICVGENNADPLPLFKPTPWGHLDSWAPRGPAEASVAAASLSSCSLCPALPLHPLTGKLLLPTPPNAIHLSLLPGKFNLRPLPKAPITYSELPPAHLPAAPSQLRPQQRKPGNLRPSQRALWHQSPRVTSTSTSSETLKVVGLLYLYVLLH